MDKQVDFRGIYMPDVITAKAEEVLKELVCGNVSIILSSGECASRVALAASNLGWDIKLVYRNESFTMKLKKELDDNICA